MVSSLTQSDVARLLSDPSTGARADVAVKLAVEIDSPRLTEGELQLAQDVVHLMAKDVEVTVRRALSEGLRRAKRLPHDVALKLANDVEAVSLPILTDSGVLTDEDLVEIVRRGSVVKQEAIAARDGLSEPVSGVLIDVAPESAVTVLMQNATAQISEQSLSQAVERFADSDAVKESMARRDFLPVSVTERLVVLVSERLKEYLVSHHDLSPSLTTDIVLQSRERAILNIFSGSSEQELEQLVAQMHETGRLTPFLVLRAICLGDMGFFEAALAVLSGVPVANARLLIDDAGPNGLRSLYEKSGLPPRLFPAMRVAVNVVRGTQYDGGDRDLERYRARVITRILTQYEDFGREDLDYLLDKLGDVLTVPA